MFLSKNVIFEKIGTQGGFSGSCFEHEIDSLPYRYGSTSFRTFSIHSRPVYQRSFASMQRTGTASTIQSVPVMESPSFSTFNSGACVQLIDKDAWRTKNVATICPAIPSRAGSRYSDAPPVSRSYRCRWVTPYQRTVIGTLDSESDGRFDVCGANRCNRFTRLLFRTQKKRTGQYSAQRAALGARTLKTGQSPFFVGYKKHTFRLWIQRYEPCVLLAPLISWIAPANFAEGCFLKPSVNHCDHRWQWRPDIIVGDMGYIAAETKRQIRERWNVAVVTKLKENMKLVPPFQTPTQAMCHQGEPLQWLGYEEKDQLHWFGATNREPLCTRCWHASECPGEFGFAPSDHETLLGLLPMNTQVSQRLLQQVRPWIEPAQSYEKNQLGLNQIFFNSLRLAWIMSLMADAAVLLRASAMIGNPQIQTPMFELTPQQMSLDFGS